MATTTFDLTSGLTDTDTVSDPADVVLAAPDGARGQVAVTRSSVLVGVHTYQMIGTLRSLPADWFEAGDSVTGERFDE
jgi:hypothetical protein